ncbi:hypothetical protein EDD52_1264 [Primorskyibacter sedentarius]|uniref:Uncharacterized protein n=1 Tax=Primorskyibacter sedentarius TaxID=745311 RepID=A0A4R3J2N3_9RHOB|nr:hypothetical protein EDD52_1264 [Primorskyibacter sedentarius]
MPLLSLVDKRVSFRRIAAVVATPIQCGMDALTLSEFEDITARYSIGLNEAHGEDSWKTLTRSSLGARHQIPSG